MNHLKTLVVALTLAGTAQAQWVARPLPQQGPAPLLYLRLVGEPGVRVTFYQGNARPREYATPAVVGVRAGYIYRIKVTGFRQRPGLELFPTFEVRGTLKMPAELSGRRYPVPIRLTLLDAERLLDGGFLTKVFYLEDPRKAIAEASRKDEAFEVELPANRNLLEEAREHGRPLLVMRLGNRDVTDAELKQTTVPNTILYPDAKGFGIPPVPPVLPWACFPWHDPISGPKPADEECLRDGGDAGAPAAFGIDGRLEGVDPEDTVASYRDSLGRRRVAHSNRVCLLVPRFAVLRKLLRVDLNRLAIGPDSTRGTEGQVQINTLQTPEKMHALEQIVSVVGRVRLSELVSAQATVIVGRIEGVRETRGRLVTADMTGVKQEAPAAPEKPLCLEKWSDRIDGEIGDVATFYIKYSNCGGKPITDVVVSDSLTGRLEYVPGTAQANRNAVFTTQPNESGSLLLSWQVKGTLQPGESGLVRFKVKIR
jgi:uncharacterized repeat protein (TIGR01451 family)